VPEEMKKKYCFPNLKEKSVAHIENCLKCVAFLKLN